MKFCMVTTFFPPYHTGGDAVFVANLSEALVRRGHQVDVVHDRDAFTASGGSAPSASYVPPPGLSVFPLTSSFGSLSPLLTHQTGRTLLKQPLHERLTREPYDVVHFHNISLIGLEALAWNARAVRVMTLHEHWLVCPTSILWRYDRELCNREECVRCTLHAGRPPQWWRYSGYLRRQLAHLDRVLAPSAFVRDSHRERGLSLPYEVLPHFVPAPPALAPDTVLPPPSPYFLYVGRLIKAKGVQTLVPAFAGTEGPRLIVAGDGEYADELKRMAAGMPRVVFVGRQSRGELSALYRGALAVIVPSLCYEVFGMVALEAFAQGTPVIARNRGALPEIVAESGAGLLFDDDMSLHEALRRLTAESGLRDRLSQAASAAVQQRWSEVAHIERYLALVSDLASQSRREQRLS